MPIPKPSVQMQLGGQWVDLSDDLLRRDGGITLSRGRRARGARTDPARAQFTLKGERYSTRNPYSDLYGIFGRLSPTRITVPGSEAYLDLPGTPDGVASTPDHADLDITGDLDLRVEATGDWYTDLNQVLIGKWAAAGNQCSYSLRVVGGRLYLNWSTNGTSSAEAWALLPLLPRRVALRATLDVDNGSGGHTVRHYWAESLDGPWNAFASPVTGGTTTTVFASTTPLIIGSPEATTTPPRVPLRGRIHRAEVRSGIGGAVVAAPDFRALAEGTTGWTDSAGRAWTVTAPAEVTTREYRATLESTASSTRSHASGHDVHTPVTASGVLQRLSQGSKPLQSTLRRRIPSEPTLVAYWPMEEGPDADRIVSPVAGVPDLRVTGMDLAADDSMPGSDALPRLRTPSSLRGLMPAVVSAGWQLEFVYFLDQMPASATEMIRVHVAGSEMWRAEVLVSTAEVRIRVVAPDGTLLGNQALGGAPVANFVGGWNRLQLFTSVSGGTTEVTVSWRNVAGNTRHYVTAGFTGSAGRPTFVAGDWPTNALEGLRLGHVAMFQGVNGAMFPASSAQVTIFEGADDGFARETAIARLRRLAAEEAPTLDLSVRDGDLSRESEAMGPQRVDTLVSLLEQVPETDGGVLLERRDRLGLEYRDRATLYNQSPTLTLDYAQRGHIAPPLEPAERAADVVNDVTVQRIGGSTGRAVIERGPLSVQPPPDGVGVQDQQVSVSAGTDGQLKQLAAWRASLGTYDGAHFVSVKVLLHAAPGLIPGVLATDVGDVIRLVNLPHYQSPDPIDLIVEGYTERWPSPLEWEITYTCSPGGPWVVGVLEDPVWGRLDTDGAVLGAAATDSATALEVHTDTAVGPRWIDSATYGAQFPFDVKFGGERATCTAVVNRADQFTRTLSGTWGTSTSGQTWVETGAAASDRSVNGTRGVITLTPSVTIVRFQRLVTTAVADCEVRVRMSVSAVATGAAAIPAVLLRYVDASNFYRARVHFGTGGSMSVSITRDTTQIGSAPALPYTYSAGAEFEVRVRLVGHTIQIKVWPVGSTEPVAWNHTETVVTNLIAAGGIGVTGSSFTGLTNTNLELRFDQFEVVTPQLMTVTRSLNGIVKAHAAGTALSLADPMRLAL